MRDQAADITGGRSLVNQITIAERNLHLAERVARIAGLDNFPRLDAFFLAHPITRRRYPRRIPNKLGCLAVADVDWMVLQSDANVVRLHLFAVLPKRQAKRRHIESDANVRLINLQLSLLNAPARQSVGTLIMDVIAVSRVPPKPR